ncbi:hypothetical protein ACSBR2_017133 [Camellia fascicularis]
MILISSAYFLADWVTPYALGLISKSTSHSTTNLLSFWAPFLLLHLGGPDNITSLSFDENEMWVKQLVHLVSQVFAIYFVFIRSLPNNHLWLPTILVFIAGICKYAERIRARRLASSNMWENSTQIVPNPGPDYEKLSGPHLAMREAHLPVEARSVQIPPKKFKAFSESDHHMTNVGDEDEGELDDRSLLQFAHFLYENFKGFIGGGSFSPEQCQFSRHFFLKRTGHDAFKVLEIELSFIHDALYTKIPVVQNKMGFVIRVLSTGSIIAASLLFFLHDKRGFSKIDIVITYLLLLGALVLEIVSILVILLSDQNVIAFKYYDWAKPIASVIVNRRRCSEYISSCNLISFCLDEILEVINKVTALRYIRVFLEGLTIMRTRTFCDTANSVKYKIFEALRMKSEIAENVETATKVCSQRGDWALMQSSCYNQLKWSLGQVEYGKSLLLWHIATDLYYYNNDRLDDDELQFCKTISDYMLYLLLMKPTMMAPVVGNWRQVFWDTTAEAKRLFHKRSIRDRWEACKAILSVDTEFEPVVLKGDASESVLFDACRLAKQLMEKEEPSRLMSKVWMELLGYAAVNCEAIVHVQQPSQGGELLTFVWLLMNHLGLGKQLCEKPTRTRYKLVVKK